MKKVQKGVTIISLVIIAAIIGILAAISIPAYWEYQADMQDDGVRNHSGRKQAAFETALGIVLEGIDGENIYFRDKKGNCWKYSVEFQIKDWVPCKNVEIVLKTPTRASQ